MNSKHTPGPWNFSKDGAEIFPETGPNGYVELCRVVGPWDGSKFYDKGTAKANARLIAAAPDMLLHLKLCRSTIKWLADKEQNSARALAYKTELNGMDKAIAKAEGKIASPAGDMAPAEE